jgi:hypothetical protein
VLCLLQGLYVNLLDNYRHRRRVAAEDRRKVSSPDDWTDPAPSRPSPACSAQAHTASLLLRQEPEQHVKDVVKEKTSAGPPASQEPITRQSECSDEHPQPALTNEYSPLLEAKVVPHEGSHSCYIVSKIDTTSNKYSHIIRGTVSQQSRPHDAEGGSLERPEVPSEFILWTPEATTPETAIGAKQDAAGNVSSCDIRPDVPQHAPYPFVVPVLPDPEPRALLFNPFHPLDMLREVEAVSKRPDMGCLNSPQARLEAAIRQPPEPQLIDMVAALMRARLARRAVSEEFHPRFPRHLPNRYSAEQSAPVELHPRVPGNPPDKPVAVGERELCP